MNESELLKSFLIFLWIVSLIIITLASIGAVRKNRGKFISDFLSFFTGEAVFIFLVITLFYTFIFLIK